MPVINVKIVKGRYEAARDKIAKAMVEAITANTDIPAEGVSVVFDVVDAEDWYVGDKSVAQLRSKSS